MVEVCVRCGVDGNEVRLFDAIYDGWMSCICERCAIIENIPVIKKPETSQLKESERGVNVYDRMKRMSGIKDVKEEDAYFREDRLNELESNPNLETPEIEKLNLIEHFHWEIMKCRRRKGLSQKQVSEGLGESEIVIQMIEKGKIPEQPETLIKKLEQFFQIRLRKLSEAEKMRMLEKKESMPILIDDNGNELDSIPEETLPPAQEGESILNSSNSEGSEIDEEEVIKIDEKGDVNIKDSDFNKVRIADLRDLHKRKIEVSRQEQIEEQQKIEERRRMIEARKEEARLKSERESNELDNVLGGSELLGSDEREVDKELV